MEFKLSNQAVGAIMMLLQKAIINTITESDDIDVVETLKEFKIVSTADGLVVKNPPVVLMSSMTNDLSNLADES